MCSTSKAYPSMRACCPRSGLGCSRWRRSAATHPYLTVPAQTREARLALGPDALVAPEQTVVLDTEDESARRTARAFLANYLRMSNYTGNMQRAGFTEHDIADGGSDRLVDEIVVHGAASMLASAVGAHLDAGADHVCLQVLPAAASPVPALSALADRLALADQPGGDGPRVGSGDRPA
jgi:probable F420-dependent oxidoreductase